MVSGEIANAEREGPGEGAGRGGRCRLGGGRGVRCRVGEGRGGRCRGGAMVGAV